VDTGRSQTFKKICKDEKDAASAERPGEGPMGAFTSEKGAPSGVQKKLKKFIDDSVTNLIVTGNECRSQPIRDVR